MPLILCDFDGELPPDLTYRVACVCRALGVRVLGFRLDKTRRGWHTIVRTSGRLSDYALIAAQALIGSDWQRERYNLFRVRQGRTVPGFRRNRWNLLFERHTRLTKGR